MSRIGDGNQGPDRPGPATSEPWPDEAETRVRSLRGAITTDLDGEPVDTDVAPLLPDLLTRLDAVSDPEPRSDLDAPTPPDSVSPPSAADEMYLLRRVETKLDELAGRARTDREAGAIRRLAETVGSYRALREEVMMRSEL